MAEVAVEGGEDLLAPQVIPLQLDLAKDTRAPLTSREACHLPLQITSPQALRQTLSWTECGDTSPGTAAPTLPFSWIDQKVYGSSILRRGDSTWNAPARNSGRVK